MKDATDIENEYKVSFENLIDRYRESRKTSKNLVALRNRFNLTLNRLIAKRNRDMSRYIKNNKKKILGLPDRKEKKYEKVKPYRMYEFSFKPTFWEKFFRFFSLIRFKFVSFFRWIYFNIVPSVMKRFLFRSRYWCSSVMYDFRLYVNVFFSRIGDFFRKIFSAVARFFVFVYGKVLAFVKVVSKFVSKFKKKPKEKLEDKPEEKLDE